MEMQTQKTDIGHSGGRWVWDELREQHWGIYVTMYEIHRGFPGSVVVKKPPARTGDARDSGSISGSGGSLRVVNGNPLQYSGLKIPTVGGLLSMGLQKSQTRLSTQCARMCAYTHTRKIGSWWEFATQHRELNRILCDKLEGWDGVGVRGMFKREGTYVYLWLIHVVLRKSTKYWKAIILWLKINLKKYVYDQTLLPPELSKF